VHQHPVPYLNHVSSPLEFTAALVMADAAETARAAILADLPDVEHDIRAATARVRRHAPKEPVETLDLTHVEHLPFDQLYALSERANALADRLEARAQHLEQQAESKRVSAPPSIAALAERLARLERENRLLHAQLNPPPAPASPLAAYQKRNEAPPMLGTSERDLAAQRRMPLGTATVRVVGQAPASAGPPAMVGGWKHTDGVAASTGR